MRTAHPYLRSLKSSWDSNWNHPERRSEYSSSIEPKNQLETDAGQVLTPSQLDRLGVKRNGRTARTGYAGVSSNGDVNLRMKKLVIALVLLVCTHRLFAGGEHSGQGAFGELPVPGATVTATAGDKKLVTATDEDGKFQLPDATAGVWTLRVEMLGFEPLTKDITVTSEPQPSAWTLSLRAFDDITR